MKGFQRWGIWADWEHPYLTLQKEYESAQIRVFGEMVLKGHIYRGLKPVHWSPSSRTALAEAELEYPDGHTSPSVYAAFPPSNCRRHCGMPSAAKGSNCPRIPGLSASPPGRDLDDNALTLPANLAVSVNERLDYALVDDGNGRLLLVAADLIDTLTTTLERPRAVVPASKGNCWLA